MLNDFLATRPDIFVYGEAGSPSPRGLVLPGYTYMLHPAKKNQRSKRRGLAIFYQDRHSHKISRAYVSKNFDIFWIRVDKIQNPLYFCFFYAPGSHHSTETHSEFYAELQRGFDKYRGTGDIFLLGDCNARLGHLLEDTDINGKYVTGKNKPHLLGFLYYIGMHLLNKIYSPGQHNL